MNWQP